MEAACTSVESVGAEVILVFSSRFTWLVSKFTSLPAAIQDIVANLRAFVNSIMFTFPLKKFGPSLYHNRRLFPGRNVVLSRPQQYRSRVQANGLCNGVQPFVDGRQTG